MYALTAFYPYAVIPVGTYPSVEACERDCETRYKVKGVKFAWKEGAWRAVVAGEEGAIVLKLVEVKTDASQHN